MKQDLDKLKRIVALQFEITEHRLHIHMLSKAPVLAPKWRPGRLTWLKEFKIRQIQHIAPKLVCETILAYKSSLSKSQTCFWPASHLGGSEVSP